MLSLAADVLVCVYRSEGVAGLRGGQRDWVPPRLGRDPDLVESRSQKLGGPRAPRWGPQWIRTSRRQLPPGSSGKSAPSASCSPLCRSWASFWQVRRFPGAPALQVCSQVCFLHLSGLQPTLVTPPLDLPRPPAALAFTPNPCFLPCPHIRRHLSPFPFSSTLVGAPVPDPSFGECELGRPMSPGRVEVVCMFAGGIPGLLGGDSVGSTKHNPHGPTKNGRAMLTGGRVLTDPFLHRNLRRC